MKKEEKKDSRFRIASETRPGGYPLYAKIPDDLKAALDDIAHDMGIRLSDVVRHAIYDYLNRYTDKRLASAPRTIITPTPSN